MHRPQIIMANAFFKRKKQVPGKAGNKNSSFLTPGLSLEINRLIESIHFIHRYYHTYTLPRPQSWERKQIIEQTVFEI